MWVSKKYVDNYNIVILYVNMYYEHRTRTKYLLSLLLVIYIYIHIITNNVHSHSNNWSIDMRTDLEEMFGRDFPIMELIPSFLYVMVLTLGAAGNRSMRYQTWGEYFLKYSNTNTFQTREYEYL